MKAAIFMCCRWHTKIDIFSWTSSCRLLKLCLWKTKPVAGQQKVLHLPVERIALVTGIGLGMEGIVEILISVCLGPLTFVF